MSVANYWCLPFSEAPVPAICSTAAAASPPSRCHHRRSLSLSRHRGSIRVYDFGQLGFVLSISTASLASSVAVVAVAFTVASFTPHSLPLDQAKARVTGFGLMVKDEQD